MNTLTKKVNVTIFVVDKAVFKLNNNETQRRIFPYDKILNTRSYNSKLICYEMTNDKGKILKRNREIQNHM